MSLARKWLSARLLARSAAAEKFGSSADRTRMASSRLVVFQTELFAHHCPAKPRRKASNFSISDVEVSVRVRRANSRTGTSIMYRSSRFWTRERRTRCNRMSCALSPIIASRVSVVAPAGKSPSRAKRFRGSPGGRLSYESAREKSTLVSLSRSFSAMPGTFSAAVCLCSQRFKMIPRREPSSQFAQIVMASG